jgi:hypothetical protein
MISHDLQALIPRFLKTTRIIWYAFMAAPLIYCVLAWFVSEGGTKQVESNWPAGALYVLILIAAVSGPVFTWGIAPLVASPQKLVGKGRDTALVTDFGNEQARYERLGEAEKRKAQHLGAIQASFIVRWAGVESVAILGLVGLFTGLVPLYGAWMFCIAALALLGILRPDYEAALDQLQV